MDRSNFLDILTSLGVKHHSKPDKQVVWNMHIDEYGSHELTPFFFRNNKEGYVLLNIDSYESVLKFRVSKNVRSKNGATKPVICDLCYTYRNNRDIRLVTFSRHDDRDMKSGIGWLCCIDFLCSAHVRNLTQASRYSRTQLRETEFNNQGIQIPLTVESMTKRLLKRCTELIELSR